MENNYYKLSESEKEKYREMARRRWSDPKILKLFQGVNVTPDFIEGAALAFYGDELKKVH